MNERSSSRIFTMFFFTLIIVLTAKLLCSNIENIKYEKEKLRKNSISYNYGTVVLLLISNRNIQVKR